MGRHPQNLPLHPAAAPRAPPSPPPPLPEVNLGRRSKPNTGPGPPEASTRLKHHLSPLPMKDPELIYPRELHPGVGVGGSPGHRLPYGWRMEGGDGPGKNNAARNRWRGPGPGG